MWNINLCWPRISNSVWCINPCWVRADKYTQIRGKNKYYQRKYLKDKWGNNKWLCAIKALTLHINDVFMYLSCPEDENLYLLSLLNSTLGPEWCLHIIWKEINVYCVGSYSTDQIILIWPLGIVMPRLITHSWLKILKKNYKQFS